MRDSVEGTGQDENTGERGLHPQERPPSLRKEEGQRAWNSLRVESEWTGDPSWCQQHKALGGPQRMMVCLGPLAAAHVVRMPRSCFLTSPETGSAGSAH